MKKISSLTLTRDYSLYHWRVYWLEPPARNKRTSWECKLQRSDGRKASTPTTSRTSSTQHNAPRYKRKSRNGTKRKKQNARKTINGRNPNANNAPRKTRPNKSLTHRSLSHTPRQNIINHNHSTTNSTQPFILCGPVVLDHIFDYMIKSKDERRTLNNLEICYLFIYSVYAMCRNVGAIKSFR